ncbi:BON domain-containing protein [Rhodoferax sp.]|uniref:BON domain-containing protein n=1 Tax=Rhodoferax sp. TaxID=50421 RepID=UPI00374DCA50
MKTKFGSYFATTALAAAMALSIVGCSKTDDVMNPAPKTSIGTEIDDTVVTASVKAALLNDQDVKSFDFKVDTHKGMVQLSGFVDNQAQVDRADVIAHKVAGVQGVENKVSIKVAQTSIGNKVDDGIVTTKVKAALLADTDIKSAAIGVVTRKGEVQLSGFVDNQEQIDRAVKVAGGVEDVQRVSNEMTVKK